MNILISSRLFYPSLGGSETDAEILAREFIGLEHTVKVVTQTRGDSLAADGLEFPFQVIRRPSPIQLFQAVQWCDIYFHNGISLRDAWPLLFNHKPWILRHQTWILRPKEDKTRRRSYWKTDLKLFLTKFATSISISAAISDHLNSPSKIIPNPYRSHLFRLIPGLSRHKELVFLGRLVSDKGVDILLEGLAILGKHQLSPQLTIIGSGPEEANLRQQTVELHLTEQV
ncbi:MAG: glycosyltransferase, partial [Leptolyngbyaceae cyanobacterium MO_188.B28]|nr:glycosyltransferase [Leptolyngbyaceae cyanobacterium MO_188.B28]